MLTYVSGVLAGLVFMAAFSIFTALVLAKKTDEIVFADDKETGPHPLRVKFPATAFHRRRKA